MKKNQIDLGLLFFRLSISGLMLVHGIPKISLLSADPIEFADPFGIGAMPSLILAIIGEVLCPILIIIGYKVRWTAIPTVITMLVAFFMIHGADEFAVQEKSLLYAVGFITLIITGGGKYVLKK